jgi:hypothetical protein
MKQNVDYNQPAVNRRAIPKYRPSLTAEQVNHILALAKTESPISELSFSLISTLAPFQAKIQNAGIQASHVMANKPSVTSMEGLGAAPTSSVNPNDMTKEEYWEVCYAMYKTNPANCNLTEIEAAQEHRYLNDLMTPEEEADHENSTS